jgi:choline-sulfatase
VSLVDLLPTFAEMAGLEDWPEVQASVDGDSLCGLLRGGGQDWKNYALAEYYSEGVCQPMRLAVRSGCKYVYVHQEEPLLFDLTRDPNELHNCINDPAYADRLGELEQIVHRGWDASEMRARVIESQQRRHTINQAMAQGRPEHWDEQPHLDATEQYVRRYDAAQTSRRMRFPRFNDSEGSRR